MKLQEMLHRVVKPRLHERFGKIEMQLDEDVEEPVAITPDESPNSLSGLGLVLEYEDLKGRKSQRVVTCRQFTVQADKMYLKAYCHHREAIRSFRLDRVTDIFDPGTGESLSPVQAFFAQYSPDKVTQSGLSWGLSVGRRADLIALLNALIFIARCDRDYHPAERQSLEAALTSFWLRLELMGNPDFDDMLSYADRLSPDGETFWIAMHRFREEPPLATIFRRHAQELIEADGIIRKEETYWWLELIEFLEDD